MRFERQMDSKAFDSFGNDGVVADYAFECSSEGELEQVVPIINYLLSRDKKIELIYCSESVHHKCIQIYQNNQEK